MTDRGRLLWVSARLEQPSAAEQALLRATAARHDVVLVSAALPPGEAPVELAGTEIQGVGVDWVYGRLFFDSIPGVRSVERLGRLVVGRAYRHQQMGDRDRELVATVRELQSRRPPDAVVCTDLGVAARLDAVDVPVIAVALADDNAGDTPGVRGGFAATEYRVRDRRDQRAMRAAVKRRRERGREFVVIDGGPDVEHGLATVLDRVAAKAGRPADADRRHRGPTSTAPRFASVVVPTFGRSEILQRTAPALVAAVQAAPGAELIVVEQGDGNATEIFGTAERVEVVRDSGIGASRARNIGAERARGDVVLFTDDDCLVPANWITEHLRVLDDPDLAASFGGVTGLSRRGDGDDAVLRQRRFSSGALPWHVGHGSNFAVRRTALLDVGGWDERLGPGTKLPAGEDADLIVRLLDRHTVQTGTGDPVVHLDWRSAEQNERNLRAYELGAGAWIGKVARARDQRVGHYLRGRKRLLAHQLAASRGLLRRLVVVSRTVLPFASGFVAGWRLPPAATAARDAGGSRRPLARSDRDRHVR